MRSLADVGEMMGGPSSLREGRRQLNPALLPAIISLCSAQRERFRQAVDEPDEPSQE